MGALMLPTKKAERQGQKNKQVYIDKWMNSVS